MDYLRTLPADTRFVSAEPLIGPLGELDLSGIDWIITGGESGPRCRECSPDWVREIRDQAQAAGVPLFHKQWGHPANHPRGKEGADDHGKGGSELDGVYYKDFPGLG
jgi:protein gp37